MALSGVACGVIVAWSSVAIAEPYPIEVTDRPLLLPRGVAVLDISIDHFSYLDHGMVTSKDHEHDVDITALYGFGPVELRGHVQGEQAQLEATFELGANLGAVSVTLQRFTHGRFRPYLDGQYITYQDKFFAIPRRLAFRAGLSADLHEISLTPADAPPRSGTTVGVGAFGSVEVQLARRLAIIPGAGIGGLVQRLDAASAGGPFFGAYLEMILAFHHWDLYAQGGLDDLNHTALPFAIVGFTHRSF